MSAPAMPVPEGLLGLSEHDPDLIPLLRSHRESLEAHCSLDVRTIELIRLGALVAIGGPHDAISSHVRRLRAEGASEADVWGVVIALISVIGVARVVQSGAAITAALKTASGEVDR
jgi:alkylhydroperoxidase/carboxymuconolactone decarboxylase family protein YurZ